MTDESQRLSHYIELIESELHRSWGTLAGVPSASEVPLWSMPDGLPPNDALSLEYKLMYGRTTRHVDVADVVNNPIAEGVAWVSGLGLKEQLSDFLGSDLGSVGDDGPNLRLVRLDSV